MNEKDFFARALEREFPVTMKVLKALPFDKSDFKPHERSQTAKQIVQTLISELTGMQNMLEDEEQIFIPVEIASIQEAIELYQETFKETLEKIKTTPEENFMKPLSGMMGRFFPRRMDGLWMFANDTIHHRGQLSVYVRLAGGKVPSIYGPSADDNPFTQK